MVSKGFYLGSNILPIISLVLSAITHSKIFSVLGVLSLLSLGVINPILWYKAWRSIQDGYASTTPGKAIGFLFIPFFNIYWFFRATHGFAKDFNKYIRRHNIDANHLPEGLFLFYCVLLIVAGILDWLNIPYFELFALMSYFISCILYLIIVSKVCDAINSVSSA